ncbi:MAG: PilZ domain-containing protein [Nitrospiraceae bacterium]|nr:MAG: PilZ domain-containing protein [Nitrospiraceae bacterium]
MDRRKYIRFDVPLNVMFKTDGNGAGYFEGVTRNFSRDGCCIESKNINVKLYETMQLQVKHPTRDMFVSLSGDIVWKQEIKDRCLAGIRLLMMDKEAKSEILDFAYDMWLEKNLK